MRESLKRIELLNKLGAVWGETMTEMRQTAYLEAFQGVHIINLEWAVNQAIKTCQFFPRPVDILNFVKVAPPIGPVQDLSRPALTERQYTPEEIEESKREFARLAGCLDGKFGECRDGQKVSEKIIKLSDKKGGAGCTAENAKQRCISLSSRSKK